MNETQKLASELVDYVAVVGAKNSHIQGVAKRLLELVTPPEKEPSIMDAINAELNGNYQAVIEFGNQQIADFERRKRNEL